jgi:hypothetical protein
MFRTQQATFVVNLYLGSNFSNRLHFAQKPDERNGPRVEAYVNKEPETRF